MKFIILAFLSFIAVSTVTYSSSFESTNLKNFLEENKSQIQMIANEKYEYTFQPFNIQEENCVGKKSQIGPVGACLITLKANEENVSATFAVTVTSHFSGTGETKPEISITLIDYTL